MRAEDDPLFGPHFRAGAGADDAIHHADHARGLASLHDDVVHPEGWLAGAWATPHLFHFPVRTPTLLPATHTNVVFVVGARRSVLIEPATPYSDELERLFGAIDALARRGAPVTEIWATHHHPDHVGGAGAICAALGLPLRAHEATLARLPGVPHGPPLSEGDREVVGGVALDVLHVPGHAPGHLVFLEPSTRAMVVGDMVAAVGTILIEPGEGDMADYLASLERLARLSPRVLVPAHGGAIRPGRDALERYVAHRLLRERRVIDALDGVPRDVDALVAHAYADTPPAIWPIAKLSLEAHLVKLEREGRARRLGAGWALA